MSAAESPLRPRPYRSRIERTRIALDVVKRIVARRGRVTDLDAARLRREGWGDSEVRAIVERVVSGPRGRGRQ